MSTIEEPVSRNGTIPASATASDAPGRAAWTDEGGPLASLRTTPENVHLFRGYGPLVVGILLFVLMITLAPTVAPERTVERPVDAPTTEEAP